MEQPAQREKFEMLAALYGWTVASYSLNYEIAYLYHEDSEGIRHPLLLCTTNSDASLIAEFKYATDRDRR